MKFYLVTLLIAFVTVGTKCAPHTTASTACYKGRLAVKGICGNYTIQLLQGVLDTSLLAASWKDETTGKTYTNAFALKSPCSFPETLNAGDEFYFVLNEEKEACNVCMAYYPTPPKKLAIKVLNKPCP